MLRRLAPQIYSLALKTQLVLAGPRRRCMMKYVEKGRVNGDLFKLSPDT